MKKYIVAIRLYACRKTDEYCTEFFTFDFETDRDDFIRDVSNNDIDIIYTDRVDLNVKREWGCQDQKK